MRYARIVRGPEPLRCQSLDAHLRGVAELAAQFGSEFDSRSWGYLAGLWHDLGKFDPRFQRRLRGEAIHVEHSGYGAAHAYRCKHELALPLAFVIAGHHAGLANQISSDPSDPRPLKERICENMAQVKELDPQVPPALAN